MTIFEKLPREVKELLQSGGYTLFTSSSEEKGILIAEKDLYFILDKNGEVKFETTKIPDLTRFKQFIPPSSFAYRNTAIDA